MDKKEQFWADKIAQEVINREKFKYTDKKITKPKQYTVKTSASLSGVLHIGRLSDTIRGLSVHRALKDAGVDSSIVWVAEDMDPLRKVPKGVPEDFSKYIGVPVTDIPDPEGCHDSYARHHTDEYFKVLEKFVLSTSLERYSMREEYKQGNFKSQIKKILEGLNTVIEIQNKYRTNKILPGWCPWSPICENCGKIITPHILGYEDGIVRYQCKDYQFESQKAIGCKHKGENNPIKGEGKLMWKSEWAAQWDRWKISTEGAGKEYQVPNSAFFINSEIVEKVLDYPSPEPIFYEHIMIDGEKMSASKGNVIYPKDWLEVADPELLHYYYNKRLMMTRSFSWKELPQLYDEYDQSGRIYKKEVSLENEREANHIKRLYQISNKKTVQKPLVMPYSHAVVISQIYNDEKDIMKVLKKTGHYQEDMDDRILHRVNQARNWVSKYGSDNDKFEVQETVDPQIVEQLSPKQKKAIKMVTAKLKDGDWNDQTLFNEFYQICKELDIKNTEFFKAGYLILLAKERGPKLAPFILALGDRAIKLFEQV